MIIVVRPGADRRRARLVVRWIRWLLPAALLLVAPAQLPTDADDDVISVDVDDLDSGPLSVADAIARATAARAHR